MRKEDVEDVAHMLYIDGNRDKDRQRATYLTGLLGMYGGTGAGIHNIGKNF